VKAFVVAEPGIATDREWPEPVVTEQELLVAPLLAGVCGTDLELIDGTIDPDYVRYPLVLGHEWVGRLERDGADLGPAGTTVVVEGVIPCGVCLHCRRGATNLCVIYDEIGFTRPGAIAQRIGVPANRVHRLGDDVDLADAVLIEPMAVVWRALTRIPLRRGLKIAVIGDGTIALLTAYLVRLLEPESTTVFGQREEQRRLARRAGATEFSTSPPSERYDVVVEASGSIDGVASAVAHADRGGMVILLGLPPHGTTATFAPDDLVNDDVIIHGSFSYTTEAFTDVVDRVNARELRPSFLITHRFSLDQASAAIDTLRGGASSEPRGKIVIELA
jgi:threonine dehydrogenase-like Zn-dependent dehydrogenase